MKQIKKEISLTKGFLVGKNLEGKKVWLQKPSWDCDWYWGYGYLQVYNNRNTLIEHCHFSKYLNDVLGWYKFRADFKALTFDIKDLWKLFELMKTFYSLKEIAQVYSIGGSHYTNNPLKDLIMNDKEVTRINEVILPEIFNEVEKIFAEESE